MKHHNYYVYILTNFSRKSLYIGVTNDLERRLSEHKAGALSDGESFASRYKCNICIYYEYYHYVQEAIDREKYLKSLSRAKKESLIDFFNPKRLDLFASHVSPPIWTLEIEDMRPW